MIHIPKNILNKIIFLVGKPSQISNTPTTVFNESRISFIADLSNILLKTPDIRDLPDVVAFAFWCRKGNLINISSIKLEIHPFFPYSKIIIYIYI